MVEQRLLKASAFNKGALVISHTDYWVFFVLWLVTTSKSDRALQLQTCQGVYPDQSTPTLKLQVSVVADWCIGLSKASVVCSQRIG